MTDPHQYTLTPETEAALRKSIKKWEANCKAESPEEVRMGVAECPLCDLFYVQNCRKCPIALAADATTCSGTPYPDVGNAYWQWEDNLGTAKENAFREAFRWHAQREVEFLKSLLPQEEPTHAPEI